jgi:hypothetical protein
MRDKMAGTSALLGLSTLAAGRGLLPMHKLPTLMFKYVLGPIEITLVAWLVAAPCHAARVYQFVDYPAFQNGYTLSGTITTTDTAPLDSILDTAEILNWQFDIAGKIPLSGSRYQFANDQTNAHGITISETRIEMPMAMQGSAGSNNLAIWEWSEVPRGMAAYNLGWSTRYDADRGTLFSYQASSFQSDFGNSRWYNDLAIPDSPPWLIAIAVPEASTLRFFVVAGLAIVLFPPLRHSERLPHLDIGPPAWRILHAR